MNHKARAIACELIAQQTNDFGDKLTALFEQVYEYRSMREAQDSKACKAIVDLVFNRLGIKIDLQLNTFIPPGCLPVMANARHVLSTIIFDNGYNSETNRFIEAIKKSNTKKGFVDLKNGKIGGIYSTFLTPVVMGFQFCKANFTPRQSAAVLMHEIGHLFIAFELMYRTVRASQILASLHQVRVGTDTSITYEHALEVAANDLTGNPREFIECVTMKDDTAVSTVVFTRTYHKLATDFGDNSVAGVNCEALADNFAAKWGFAEDMVSLWTGDQYNTELGRVNAFESFLLYVGPVASSILAGISLGLASAVAGIAAGILLTATTIFYSGRGDRFIQQANQYDKPYVRLQRIRETVVAQLKNFELDHVTRERLLKELDSIDKMLKGGRELTTLAEDIANIFTSNRRASFAFRLERDIELLAHNDLFVNAQRLASKA